MSNYDALRRHLQGLVRDRHDNGAAVEGLWDEAAGLPDSFDAALAFVSRLNACTLRPDWPYVEPDRLDDIQAEAAVWSPRPIASPAPEDAARRVEAAFLGSVCGCILGKPVEFNPTRAELETMLGSIGEWPLADYISEKFIAPTLARRGEPMPAWNQTYRERIHFVMPDDDINYTILGMLLLETHGATLTTEDVRQAWLHHLPSDATYGPERVILATSNMQCLFGALPFFEEWSALLDGGDGRGYAHCGAQIRADAYGYACPGDPALAASLAYQDAALTHRGTGLYATMWTAAAIAVALTAPRDPLDIFRVAAGYVPRRSRFYKMITDGLAAVENAGDWQAGYAAIHARYGEFGHCDVYQESATLINTLRFARRVDEGICIQVMQGNDTDSYGATAGSLLGASLGPGHLDEARWLSPFQDDIRTALAWFFERSLSALARRMGELPSRLSPRRFSPPSHFSG